MVSRERKLAALEKALKSKSVIDATNKSLLRANGGVKRTIVYADPPWKYSIERHPKGEIGMNGLANHHYPTMALTDLKQIRVQDIVSDNALMFMWSTGPQMLNSIELMKSWGFSYKTVFMVWAKTHKGKINSNRLGFYTRQCCEYVLLGSRGGGVLKYKDPTYRKATANIFRKDSKRHSSKPRFVRKLIDRMFLNVPKIELFARDTPKPKKWDYWGNEVEKTDRTSKWKRARKRQIRIYKNQTALPRGKNGKQIIPTSPDVDE
jgi:N6-adenosine-specific RNA methylase IME4